MQRGKAPSLTKPVSTAAHRSEATIARVDTETDALTAQLARLNRQRIYNSRRLVLLADAAEIADLLEDLAAEYSDVA